MGKLLLVCLGGALGSGLRYLVQTWALSAFGPDFPRGTLFVNVAGSFLLAALMTASLSGANVSPELRLLVGAGVLGGFTTYSTFNWETLGLVQQGSPGLALLNVAATVLGCLGAGLLGALLGRALSG